MVTREELHNAIDQELDRQGIKRAVGDFSRLGVEVIVQYGTIETTVWYRSTTRRKKDENARTQ